MTDFKRRADINRQNRAEGAIRAAIKEVEALGADVRLTDAVVLLGAAQRSVADFEDKMTPSPRRLVTEEGSYGAPQPEQTASGAVQA